MFDGFLRHFIIDHWTKLSSCADYQKGKGGASADPSSAKGPMGPVFSTFVHEEESDNEL